MCEQKRQDRPNREKIRELQHLQFLVIRAHVEGKISDDENVCYVNYITEQLLTLIPDIEEAAKRGMATAITAYESTCEALIQEAKKQERERILGILQKEYPAIDTWQCWRDLSSEGVANGTADQLKEELIKEVTR